MSADPIELYGYTGFAGLPDVSPFVAKLEAYLRLAELPYTKRLGDTRKAPRNKLPYIVHGGRSISDSQRIVEYLAEAKLADLDAWLDADQRAELFVLRSMLETDLYFIIVYFRWQADAGWARYRVGVQAFLRAAGVPALLLGPLLKVIRRKVVAQVVAQGAGRRDADENLEHARGVFAALEQTLARHPEGPWWFGDTPSSADAIVHAFVSAAIVPGLDVPLEQLAQPHARLRAWFDHVDPRVAAS